MDVIAFLPVVGNTIWEMLGGPWDKLQLQFDADHAPERLVFDGHVYEKVVKTFEEYVRDEDGEFLNDPSELFVTEYRYCGKQGKRRTGR